MCSSQSLLPNERQNLFEFLSHLGGRIVEGLLIYIVLFITNYPSPYRVNFYDELGKYLDVTVLS